MSSHVHRALPSFAVALFGAALALHAYQSDRHVKAELAALRTALATESEARLALADAMQGAPGARVGAPSVLPAPPSQVGAPAADAADSAPEATAAAAAGAQPGLPPALLERIAQRQPHHFDENRLLELGLGQTEVRFLHDAFERARTDLLSERQEARLDRDRKRGRSALRDVRAALREELGDDQYDLMLYAANLPNRVRIGEVLPGSAAEAAGFRGDDVIVSYDGARVFRGQELYTAMAQRERGQEVPLRVERGGQVVDLRLPTGALGMTLQQSVQKPAQP